MTNNYKDHTVNSSRRFKLPISSTSTSSYDNIALPKIENSRFKIIQRRQTRTNTLLASITILFVLAWLPLHIFNLVMDKRESLILREPFDITLLPQTEYVNKSITEAYNSNQQFEIMNQQMTAFSLPPINNKQKENSKYGIGRKITLIHSFCLLCVLVSACANPVLYGWLNENFHRELTLMFPWIFRTKQQDSTVSMNADRNYPSTLQ
ncbi:unnamed protein product [Trichobilharzia szidati]|nr:unnamed protein product [Trichobilharzia szidati]